MKVLLGYSGIGLIRKLWTDIEVTAIDNNHDVADEYLEHYPDDEFIVTDAHEYILKNYKKYDFIQLSPPCPSHSKTMKFTRHDVVKYPDMKLYQEIILLDNFFDGLYAVENVVPYYDPLMPAQKVDRHLWWSNFKIGNFQSPKYNGDYLKANKADLEKFYDFKVSRNIYFEGSHDPAKCLKNGVHPETGLYILNCARNIITKSNVNQLDVFEDYK